MLQALHSPVEYLKHVQPSHADMQTIKEKTMVMKRSAKAVLALLGSLFTGELDHVLSEALDNLAVGAGGKQLFEYAKFGTDANIVKVFDLETVQERNRLFANTLPQSGEEAPCKGPCDTPA